MTDKIKLDYRTIGDCYYDIYCQPETITKQRLLKDMADILNGKLTAEDFRNEILAWIQLRDDQCYLENGEIKRYDERRKNK